MNEILKEIVAERQRQDAKFGVQNHKPIEWIGILGEEFGEASKEAIEYHFAEGQKGMENPHPDQSLCKYRQELVQIAAVAVSMIQCLDRGIDKDVIFTTADGMEIKNGDELYFVFLTDTVVSCKKGTVKKFKWTMTGGPRFHEGHPSNDLELYKWFSSKEKAEEFSKSLLWQPGALYWVKPHTDSVWDLRYSSNEAGRVYLNQRKEGPTLRPAFTRLATGMALPE